MIVDTIISRSGGRSFHNALVYDDTARGPRPLVLISPNWMNVTPNAITLTKRIVGSRYIGFVVDMYGDGQCPDGPDAAGALANAVRADTDLRRARISAAFESFVAEAGKRLIGDRRKAAAIGFCFGGGNVLELARMGTELSAVVSVHGEFKTQQPAAPGAVKAPILVLHGSMDPITPKPDRDLFEAEMDAAGARWKMVTYGGLVHSFCEEDANVPGVVMFDKDGARDAYRMIDAFLEQSFST
jgi:dienelactone hydrolase